MNPVRGILRSHPTLWRVVGPRSALTNSGSGTAVMATGCSVLGRGKADGMKVSEKSLDLDVGATPRARALSARLPRARHLAQKTLPLTLTLSHTHTHTHTRH